MMRVLLLIFLIIFPKLAFSHGGRTNAQGCHNNSKTGDYHCHSSNNKATQSKQASNKGNKNNKKYYANCTQARMAGAAPILRGEEGYAKHLDRDNDGIACE